MTDKVVKSDTEWQARLSPGQYAVTRQKATERPFSGEYDHHFQPGEYACVCCGQGLFLSEAKFDSGCGWPAFSMPAAPEAVAEEKDRSHGMIRTEVLCSKCDAHLGHVFDDGPGPAGLRYCINSLSLRFRPK